VRFRDVADEILGRDYRQIKPFERITHPAKLIQPVASVLNGRLPEAVNRKENPPATQQPADLSVRKMKGYQPALG